MSRLYWYLLVPFKSLIDQFIMKNILICILLLKENYGISLKQFVLNKKNYKGKNLSF